MVVGVVVGLLVVMRVFWGVTGQSLCQVQLVHLRPASVIRYVQDAFRGQDERHVGHNPS